MKTSYVVCGLLFSAFVGMFVWCTPMSFAENIINIPFNGNDVNLYTFPDDESQTKIANPGVKEINDTLFAIVKWMRFVLGIFATIWIVWQGYRMLSAHGDESQFTSAKTTIMWGIIGLVISFLIEPVVRTVLYGGDGGLTPGQAILNPEVATATGRAQLQGFMQWIKTMLGVIAVAMIVFNGIRSMFALGTEDETDKQKTNILWIMIGIIIIIFNEIIVNYGLYGDPKLENNKPVFVRDVNRIIAEFSGLIDWILTFFATLSVAAIVYGGFLILTAQFNDAQADKGKNIIKFVLMGISIVLISYVLVRTVIFMQT